MFKIYFLWGLALLLTVASKNTTTTNSTSSYLDNITSTVTENRITNNVTLTLEETLDLTFNVSNPWSDSNEQTSNVTFSETNEFHFNSTTTSIDSQNNSESTNDTIHNSTIFDQSFDIKEQPSDVKSVQETTENTMELSSTTTVTLETLQNATRLLELTSVEDTTTIDTATITSTEVNAMSSESNDMPGYIWFVLILDGNCSINDNDLENLRDRVEDGVTHWFEIGRRDLAIQNTSCTSPDQMLVNITMFRKPGTNVSALLTSLEDLGRPLVRVKNHDYYVFKILTIDGYINKEPDIDVDMKHSDVELVIYIAVGSCCAFMILLIVGLLLCKYCDCREPKQFDFGETPPNLNMRLEDYTLTRIPRPKLGYVDYYRGLSKRYSPLDDKIVTSPNGMVQPFDTSVVPLEDAYAQDAAARSAPCSTFRDYRDGIIVRPSDINRFGQSLTKIYRSGRGKIIGKRTNNTTDGDGYDTRSTENLHRSHKEDRFIDRGLDNPVYH